MSIKTRILSSLPFSNITAFFFVMEFVATVSRFLQISRKKIFYVKVFKAFRFLTLRKITIRYKEFFELSVFLVWNAEVCLGLRSYFAVYNNISTFLCIVGCINIYQKSFCRWNIKSFEIGTFIYLKIISLHVCSLPRSQRGKYCSFHFQQEQKILQKSEFAFVYVLIHE